MDFVTDDLDVMNAELSKWKAEFERQQQRCVEEEKYAFLDTAASKMQLTATRFVDIVQFYRKTQTALSPLHAKIEELDTQIADYRSKINRSKAAVLRLDAQIQALIDVKVPSER